ncbi:hypothetical protein, partial [Streptomyces formicae]
AESPTSANLHLLYQNLSGAVFDCRIRINTGSPGLEVTEVQTLAGPGEIDIDHVTHTEEAGVQLIHYFSTTSGYWIQRWSHAWGANHGWMDRVHIGNATTSTVSEPYRAGGDFDIFTFGAVSGGGGGLSVVAQDQESSMWYRRAVVPAVAVGVAREEARFRLAFTVSDPGGAPLAGVPVSVRTAEGQAPVEVFLQGRLLLLNHSPMPLYTDGHGRVTLSVPASGIYAPVLVVTAFGLLPRTFDLCRHVTDYLAGQESDFNPTNKYEYPPFTEEDPQRFLRAAKLPDGSPLVAAGQPDSDVQAAALSTVNLARASNGTLPTAGFRVRLGGGGEPMVFEALAGAADVAAARADLIARHGLREGAADASWLGDLWEGIARSLLTVTEFVIDAVNKVVTLTIDGISFLVEATWRGIQELGRIIVSVLQRIGVAISDALEWLKALFDLDAIRRTQAAIESQITTGLTVLETGMNLIRPDISRWFAQKGTVLGQTLDRMITDLDDGIGGLLPEAEGPKPQPGWFRDVHMTWTEDKLDPGQARADIQDTGFATRLSQVGEQLYDPLREDLSGASRQLQDFFLTPQTLNDTYVPTLLRAVKDLLLTAVDLAGRTTDAALAVITDIITWLKEQVHRPVTLPPFMIYTWRAVTGSDSPPTFAGLAALLLAIPVTIGHKLIHGRNTEPFPPPSTPQPHTGNPQHGIHVGLTRLAMAGIEPFIDAVEFSADNANAHKTAAACGLIELCLFASDFGFTWAAEYGAELPSAGSIWDLGGFVLPYTIWATANIPRFVKRWVTAQTADLYISIVVALFQLAVFVLLLYVAYQQRPAGHELGTPDVMLCWAGALAVIPDWFAPFTSLNPPAGAYGLFIKMAVDTVAFSASGMTTASAYNLKNQQNADGHVTGLNTIVNTGSHISMRYATPQPHPGNRIAIYPSPPTTASTPLYEQPAPDASGTVTFPTDNWPPGSYLAHLTNDTGTPQTEPHPFTVTHSTLHLDNTTTQNPIQLTYHLSHPHPHNQLVIPRPGSNTEDQAHYHIDNDTGLITIDTTNWPIGTYTATLRDHNQRPLTHPVTIRIDPPNPIQHLTELLALAGAPDTHPPSPLTGPLTNVQEHPTQNGYAATAQAPPPPTTPKTHHAHITVARIPLNTPQQDPVIAIIHTPINLDTATLPLLNHPPGHLTIHSIHFTYTSRPLTTQDTTATNTWLQQTLGPNTPTLPTQHPYTTPGWTTTTTHTTPNNPPTQTQTPWPHHTPPH